jgi:uncharacterized membrane protein
VGTLFGVFSFLQATVPMFKDPLVAVLPRVFIGVTAWLAYTGLKGVNEYLALVAAAVVGTLTNTVGVLLMAVLRGYMAPGVAWTVGLTHGLPEVVVAAILTVAIVVAWKRVETGSGEAKM